MSPSSTGRRAVSNAVFGITVVVLVAVAASGFALYGYGPAMRETMTVTASDTMTHSPTSSVMSETTASHAAAFTAAQGQMFGNGWLIIAPLGNGSYAVALHATGLEPAAMGEYIVEAAQNTGQMAMVPIAGANVSLSEFVSDGHGDGQFFVVLHKAPSSIYESVSIVYLPGMRMQDATVVATAPVTTL